MSGSPISTNTQEIIMKTPIVSTNVRRLVIATILGSLAFGCAAVCIADNNDEVPHAAVKFADLNLSSPAGAAALYRRIYAAAHDVCGSFDADIRDLRGLSRHAACVHKAVRNAVAKVNQPALSAIYNARNRDPLLITVAAALNR